MTDEEAIDEVFSLFEMRAGEWATIRRNGRILLALPPGRRGALQGLKLYQPQRLKARASMAALRLAAGLGLHRWVLPGLRHAGGIVETEPDLPRALPYSTGILLGSPEHRVRRAIASYQTAWGWEVAKIAFGPEGWDVIHGEAAALQSLPEQTPGAPALLGIHRAHSCSMIRLPLVRGSVLRQGDAKDAISLLDAWLSDAPLQEITAFPEWPAIQSALSGSERGRECLDDLAQIRLRPAVRHGDFARWNLLRQRDGSLVVLDWEWGTATGMPGIDLVHFFAQDARLVRGLAPAEVIRSVARSLERPACREYLEQTGWGGEAMLAILASIAFTVGARQQANEEVMEAALEAV
jgi:hypothetical protein